MRRWIFDAAAEVAVGGHSDGRGLDPRGSRLAARVADAALDIQRGGGAVYGRLGGHARAARRWRLRWVRGLRAACVGVVSMQGALDRRGSGPIRGPRRRVGGARRTGPALVQSRRSHTTVCAWRPGLRDRGRDEHLQLATEAIGARVLSRPMDVPSHTIGWRGQAEGLPTARDRGRDGANGKAVVLQLAHTPSTDVIGQNGMSPMTQRIQFLIWSLIVSTCSTK